MSRTLTFLLLTALLALPALARADARLSLKVLQLTMLQAKEPDPTDPPRTPLRVRALEAVERIKNRILSLDTILGRVELHAAEAAHPEGVQVAHPCQLAMVSSAPAGVFDRGPVVGGPRLVRLPRFAF